MRGMAKLCARARVRTCVRVRMHGCVRACACARTRACACTHVCARVRASASVAHVPERDAAEHAPRRPLRQFRRRPCEQRRYEHEVALTQHDRRRAQPELAPEDDDGARRG
eukprot:5476347-Pleurochrysis_carterae.AAC.1